VKFFAGNILHNEVRPSVFRAVGVKQLHDVGMIQKRDDLPLSQEPAPEFLVFAVRQPQDLDGYLLMRLLRACGKVNIAVSTGTQPPVDLVGANFPVGHRIL